MDDSTMPMHLNPFILHELDDSYRIDISQNPEQHLWRIIGRFLDVSNPLDSMKCRYAEATEHDIETVFFPVDQRIANYILTPLVNAKRCYILGMPDACIAQSGLVGEMVVIWRYEMIIADPSSPECKGLPSQWDVKKFEKKTQSKRIKILRDCGDIDNELFDTLYELRDLRNKHLHIFNKPANDVYKDARSALFCAMKAVYKTLDIKYEQGRVILPNRVLEYLSNIICK